MSNRLVDLVQPDSVLPEAIAVDSNIVITWLESASAKYVQRREVARAALLFQQLNDRGSKVVLTPTAFSEVIHSAVKSIYADARTSQRSQLRSHYGRNSGFSWVDLYKIDPDVLRRQQLVLEQLRAHLQADRLILPDFADLPVAHPGRRFDQELVRLVGRYGLDTTIRPSSSKPGDSASTLLLASTAI